MSMARLMRREWLRCGSYLLQKNLWRTRVLNASRAFKTDEGFFLEACGGFRFTMNAAAEGFLPLGGRFGRAPHSDGCFFQRNAISPTTLLVAVPAVRPHILFTTTRRRKNERIEAHFRHISSPVDAERCCPAERRISFAFRLNGARKGCADGDLSCNKCRIPGARSFQLCP